MPTIPPPDDHPAFLTTSAQRTRAAQAIRAAAPGVDLAGALIVADILDLMSGATLAAVGVSGRVERFTVCAILWTEL
jgi:hypothetical protein